MLEEMFLTGLFSLCYIIDSLHEWSAFMSTNHEVAGWIVGIK